MALDRDPGLLAALADRGAGLSVSPVVADARAFDLGRSFPLVIVPMQTLQLLGGREGRGRFLACARAAPGDRRAAGRRRWPTRLESFDVEHDEPPKPDLREVGGIVYASRPVAVRDLGDRAAIERVREIVARDGTRTVSDDVIELDRVDVDVLAAEAAAFGLRAETPRRIPQTRRVRRLDGGDAPWLSGPCASARCIPTS